MTYKWLKPKAEEQGELKYLNVGDTFRRTHMETVYRVTGQNTRSGMRQVINVNTKVTQDFVINATVIVLSRV